MCFRGQHTFALNDKLEVTLLLANMEAQKHKEMFFTKKYFKRIWERFKNNFQIYTKIQKDEIICIISNSII